MIYDEEQVAYPPGRPCLACSSFVVRGVSGDLCGACEGGALWHVENAAYCNLIHRGVMWARLPATSRPELSVVWYDLAPRDSAWDE